MDLSQGLTPYILLYALAMGVISFASPCILPLIPSYVSYITGISYDELVSRESRRKNMGITLLHSLTFVAGFSIITNLGAGMSNTPLSHEQTMNVAEGAATKLRRLLNRMIAGWVS